MIPVRRRRAAPASAPARRGRLPYVVAAALVGGVAAGALLAAAAGWRGGVRYTAVPTVTMPLAAATVAVAAAAAPTADGDGGVPPPAVARERLGGVDALAAAVPAAEGDGPVVALVLTGIGLARERGEAALRLPPPFALAVSPYADEPGRWLERVRAAGHEPLLALPLEAADVARVDAGPLALRVGATVPEREAALGRVLAGGGAEAEGAVAGVAAEAGAFAAPGAAGREAFAPVAEALAGRGLVLVELDGGHLAPRPAGRPAYASAGRAVDEAPAAADVALALGGLEARALRDGAAVGWARGHPATLERLAAWAASLPGKGLRLATVRAALAAGAGGGAEAGGPRVAAGRRP